MDTKTPPQLSPANPQEWKSLAYQGKQIHVCTTLRAHENRELSGHGQQWDFKVRVTAGGTGRDAAELASAESDSASLYSTQAVTEDLGFARGRELVDAI